MKTKLESSKEIKQLIKSTNQCNKKCQAYLKRFLKRQPKSKQEIRNTLSFIFEIPPVRPPVVSRKDRAFIKRLRKSQLRLIQAARRGWNNNSKILKP